MKACNKIGKLVLLLIMAVFLLVPSIRVHAEVQVTDLSKLMVTKNTIDAFEEPSEQSKTTITYEAGASVMVTGETADGWYRVAFQDKVGFVKKTDLQEAGIDIAALDEEFEVNEVEGKIFVEEVVRIREQITRSRIWGTIIVLLIVGIFGTGIYSTIKSEQNKKQKDETENVVEAVQKVNDTETMKEENAEIVEPLSFEASEMEPLDIIDLDNQES